MKRKERVELPETAWEQMLALPLSPRLRTLVTFFQKCRNKPQEHAVITRILNEKRPGAPGEKKRARWIGAISQRYKLNTALAFHQLPYRLRLTANRKAMFFTVLSGDDLPVVCVIPTNEIAEVRKNITREIGYCRTLGCVLHCDPGRCHFYEALRALPGSNTTKER